MASVPRVAPAAIGILPDRVRPELNLAVTGISTPADRASSRCAVTVTDSPSFTVSGAVSDTIGMLRRRDRHPHPPARAPAHLRRQVRTVDRHPEALVLGVAVRHRRERARAAGLARRDRDTCQRPVIGAGGWRLTVRYERQRNRHRARQRPGERRRDRHAVARPHRVARGDRQFHRRGVVVVDGHGHRGRRARRHRGRQVRRVQRHRERLVLGVPVLAGRDAARAGGRARADPDRRRERAQILRLGACRGSPLSGRSGHAAAPGPRASP